MFTLDETSLLTIPIYPSSVTSSFTTAYSPIASRHVGFRRRAPSRPCDTDARSTDQATGQINEHDIDHLLHCMKLRHYNLIFCFVYCVS